MSDTWFLGCRYVAPGRTTDDTSTKHYREKLRKLELEVLRDDGAFALCRGSDGQYYAWIPLSHLQTADGQDVYKLLLKWRKRSEA